MHHAYVVINSFYLTKKLELIYYAKVRYLSNCSLSKDIGP